MEDSFYKIRIEKVTERPTLRAAWLYFAGWFLGKVVEREGMVIDLPRETVEILHKDSGEALKSPQNAQKT